MYRIASRIIVLACMVLLCGCATTRTPEEPLDAMALAHSKDAPGVELGVPELRRLAETYRHRHDNEMALVYLSRAIVLEPDNLDLRAERGEMLAVLGHDEQALREFQEILAKNPDHALANEQAGAIYFRAGLVDQARPLLLRAVEQNPSDWQAHCYMGIIHNRDGQYDAAVSEFNTVLALNPGNGEALNNLGVARLMRGEYAQAAEFFRRAVNAGDGSPRTYNNLGVALARTGRLAEALDAFRYGGDEAKAYNNLGYVLLLEGQNRKAVECFEKAIEVSPSYYAKAFENLKRARMSGVFDRAAVTAPKAVFPTSSPTGSIPGVPAPGRADGRSVVPPVSADLPPLSNGPQARVGGRPSAAPASAVAPVVTSASGAEAAGGAAAYGLHVSSWREEAHALKHCRELRDQGLQACVVRADLGEKGVWWRVMVGSYENKDSAAEARPAVLRQLGIDRAMVYRVPSVPVRTGAATSAEPAAAVPAPATFPPSADAASQVPSGIPASLSMTAVADSGASGPTKSL